MTRFPLQRKRERVLVCSSLPCKSTGRTDAASGIRPPVLALSKHPPDVLNRNLRPCSNLKPAPRLPRAGHGGLVSGILHPGRTYAASGIPPPAVFLSDHPPDARNCNLQPKNSPRFPLQRKRERVLVCSSLPCKSTGRTASLRSQGRPFKAFSTIHRMVEIHIVNRL